MTEYLTKTPGEERPYAVLYADLEPSETIAEDLGWLIVPQELDAQALDVIVSADMGDHASWTETHPVLTEGFVVAAPRGVLSDSRDILAQLKALPMIQYTTRHYMGRLIATHLEQQNLRLDHRFELDSYHAILALVSGGMGWTILPPLALLRARRLMPDLDIRDLPFAPLSRRIVLIARKSVLEDVPARIAAELRSLLSDLAARAGADGEDWVTRAARIDTA